MSWFGIRGAVLIKRYGFHKQPWQLRDIRRDLPRQVIHRGIVNCRLPVFGCEGFSNLHRLRNAVSWT
jgi:hypothetical protein